jgi:hypothetical protein
MCLPPRWLGRPRGWRPDEESQLMRGLRAKRVEITGGVDTTCAEPGCDRVATITCTDERRRCEECMGLLGRESEGL